MDAFTTHTGRAVALKRSNVDTDQIIPAVYLKRVTRTGFADGLFAAWRSDPGFVLNQPAAKGATILVAGSDFGTGSSREHAVWALQDYGFRVVISSRFADIFLGNSGKGGLVTALVDQKHVEALWAAIDESPRLEVTVDLRSRTVSWPDEEEPGGRASVPFDIDDYTRWRLLEGLDDIDLTLRHAAEIEAFERTRPGWLPSTA